MKEKNQAIVTDFLKRNGVTDRKKAAEIMSGFDLDKPIYLSRLEKGERLFQFLRNEGTCRRTQLFRAAANRSAFMAKVVGTAAEPSGRKPSDTNQQPSSRAHSFSLR